jgi:hypothetical protein
VRRFELAHPCSAMVASYCEAELIAQAVYYGSQA